MKVFRNKWRTNSIPWLRNPFVFCGDKVSHVVLVKTQWTFQKYFQCSRFCSFECNILTCNLHELNSWCLYFNSHHRNWICISGIAAFPILSMLLKREILKQIISPVHNLTSSFNLTFQLKSSINYHVRKNFLNTLYVNFTWTEVKCWCHCHFLSNMRKIDPWALN